MQHAIRVAALFCLLAFTAIFPANAQSFSIVELPGGCGTGSYANSLSYLTVDSQLKLCVNATVSASITGFPGTSQSTGTPISVTTGGVTGTLPSGAVVVASNVGATNGAYCKLGASATTSDQLIPPNSWFSFTVGTNTQLTCITSTSTTTVNMVGGAGLPTGSGGGGGGGSLAGNVSNASSAVATSSTNIGAVSWLYGFNGTTWDQLQVDGSKNLKVTGSVFGPTVVGTAAANPPVLAGGTADGTATGAVAVQTIKTGSSAATTDKAVVVADPNVLAAINGASTVLAGTTPTTQSAATSGTVTKLQSDLNGNLYIAPSQVVTEGPAAPSASVPVQLNVNTTPTDCSSTITSGGTAQAAIAAQTTLHGFTIGNIDSTAGSGEPLWISFTGTAAASTAGSYPLAAPTATTFAGFSSYSTPPGFGTNHAVSIIGVTTGHKFSCTWW